MGIFDIMKNKVYTVNKYKLFTNMYSTDDFVCILGGGGGVLDTMPASRYKKNVGNLAC